MTAWGRGRPLGMDKEKRIVQLLRGSELSLMEIAERLQCSRGAVSAVNRNNKVRSYNGRRNYWTLNSAGVAVNPIESSHVANLSPKPVQNSGVIWI